MSWVEGFEITDSRARGLGSRCIAQRFGRSDGRVQGLGLGLLGAGLSSSVCRGSGFQVGASLLS